MQPRFFGPIWLIGLLALIALAACAPPPATAEVPVTPTHDVVSTMVAETLAAQPTPEPTSTHTLPPPTSTPIPPTPTPKPPERPHYTLDVDFNYDQRAGSVRERIVYVNNSADSLTDLPLMIELMAFQDSFQLTGIWWADDLPVQKVVRDRNQLWLGLPDPLLPGQTVELRLAYTFRLPSSSSIGGERPMPIGYTARQANLVEWYPFIPPYIDGQGWLAPHPAYYGEHLAYDLADFEVNLRLTDAREDLVVAASAPAEADGGLLRYRRQSARGFALSVSHEYRTESQQVGDILVTSYFFPYHEAAGLAVLQATVESIVLYQELFGPYPHDSLAVVEADFLDGMEYDGLYFLSRGFYNIYRGTPDDYLIAIAVHETAHQWWYGIVGNDQANEPWLDEALSTYTELLYYERYAPEALDWWWTYRIDYYGPRGWIDTSVYNPGGVLQSYQDYRNAVYLNGAYFFADCAWRARSVAAPGCAGLLRGCGSPCCSRRR
jgi:hypothetical protein